MALADQPEGSCWPRSLRVQRMGAVQHVGGSLAGNLTSRQGWGRVQLVGLQRNATRSVLRELHGRFPFMRGTNERHKGCTVTCTDINSRHQVYAHPVYLTRRSISSFATSSIDLPSTLPCTSCLQLATGSGRAPEQQEKASRAILAKSCQAR